MVAHPNRSRSRLAQYGARLRTIDGRKVVEMVNPNDNARARYQYRRSEGGDLESRTLLYNGRPDNRGSPWAIHHPKLLAAMRSARGDYHPILDPLGL